MINAVAARLAAKGKQAAVQRGGAQRGARDGELRHAAPRVRARRQRLHAAQLHRRRANARAPALRAPARWAWPRPRCAAPARGAAGDAQVLPCPCGHACLAVTRTSMYRVIKQVRIFYIFQGFPLGAPARRRCRPQRRPRSARAGRPCWAPAQSGRRRAARVAPCRSAASRRRLLRRRRRAARRPRTAGCSAARRPAPTRRGAARTAR